MYLYVPLHRALCAPASRRSDEQIRSGKSASAHECAGGTQRAARIAKQAGRVEAIRGGLIACGVCARGGASRCAGNGSCGGSGTRWRDVATRCGCMYLPASGPAHMGTIRHLGTSTVCKVVRTKSCVGKHSLCKAIVPGLRIVSALSTYMHAHNGAFAPAWAF